MSGNSPPEHWSRKTLRDLATINYGRDPSAILDASGPYPVYGTSGNERRGTAFLYDGDSIILGRKGTIDRVHYATGRFWTIDTAYFLSRFNETFPKWLFYFLSSVDLKSLNEATGVPSLSRDLLYRISVPIPTRCEQAKIAEILSTVDQAIEQSEALIAKRQRVKTGLMQDLLTRGIDKQGNLRSAQTHEFKASPLGPIPVEWDVVSLAEASVAIVDCPHTTPRFVHDGVFVVRTFNVKDGRITGDRSLVSEPEYADRVSRLRPQARDVILTREAPVGEAFVVPRDLRLCLGQRTMLIRCNPDKCVPEYLVESMYSESMRLRFDQMVGGTTNPHLNVGDVRALQLLLPSADEQKRIQKALSAIRCVLDAEWETVEKLRALKSGMMLDLLTAQRRVTSLLTKLT